MDKVMRRLLEIIEQMSDEERVMYLSGLEKSTSGGRKHVRQLFPAVVDYSVDNRFYKDFLRDISKGGVFMETRVPLSMGAEIAMSFPMPKKNQSLKVTGIIVRVSPEGVGIQFKRLEEMEKILSQL